MVGRRSHRGDLSGPRRVFRNGGFGVFQIAALPSPRAGTSATGAKSARRSGLASRLARPSKLPSQQSASPQQFHRGLTPPASRYYFRRLFERAARPWS